MKGLNNMADYKQMYHKMFNALTDAEKLLECANTILREAQQECEELYIQASDTLITFPEKPAKR